VTAPREHRYHFVSRWTVDAPADAVYAAIYEVVSYPAWWPEVKEARKLDEDHLWMRTRSILPYDLAFDLQRTIADPRGGILEARLTGDLEGVIRWTIEPAADGCLITFDEDVVTNKTALNRLASIVRPAYVANHALMMAHGQAGLRTFLAGYALARQSSVPD
jgi:ribosome-associated toxin RatA of RatAB toxin-antitoxin module